MRLCSFRDGHRPRLGLVQGDLVQPLEGRDVKAALAGALPDPAGAPRPLAEIELLAPLRPGKLIGIGHNYRLHVEEVGAALPREPVMFAKLPSAVTAPGGPVLRPAYTRELDYEGEVAVVIGSRACRVGEARALQHVAGYAVIDDVTARDCQRAEPQWVRAKGGDTFAPLGPWLTTAEEVPDPTDLRICTWVNGDLRQDGSTSDMIFGVAELVAYCSRQFTLEPGDVIATGTPAGVGAGRRPPVFLEPGDRVRIEIERLGAIEHEISEAA